MLRRRHSSHSGTPTTCVAEAPVPRTNDAPPSDVEVITTLARLDEKLHEIDVAAKISDDAAREVFATFRMAIAPDSELSPWSAEYRQEQFDLYCHISSRSDYTTANEICGYAVDPKMPFPYYTQSWATVSDQLMACGFMIKTMALPAKSSILEFGPGWGNTTVALARMGYDVTALDIDPTFVQLIRDRADLLDLTIDARVGQFTDAGLIDRQYDAVLFYECFHHCSDHVQLLRDLHRLINPDGRVFLAAEPILESFHAPWGVRLDGESLWAARQNGWLELGFTESYFLETAVRQGWRVSRYSSDASFLTSIFCLIPLGDTILPGQMRLPPADEIGWAMADSAEATQRYTSSRSRLVCPVGGSWTTVRIDLVNPAPFELPYVVQHGAKSSRGRIAAQSRLSIELPYDTQAGALVFETDTWCPAQEIAGSTDPRQLGLGVLEVVFR